MQRADTLLATGYRYFLLVAETGSVRAAARQANIAASAISRQLSLLEDQLGIYLFERSGRGLLLTPAGRALQQGLKVSARGHEQTLDLLQGLRGLKRGLVRVATVESLSVSLLPDILERFSERHPALQIEVIVAGSDAVTELVRDHTSDIGFTFNPTLLEGLEVDMIRDMTLGAVLAPSHLLAGAEILSLATCLEHPVAWPRAGLSLRTILEPVARSAKPGFKPRFESNSLRMMASLARRGSCIAFQTRIGIEQEIQAGELLFVPLSDRKLPVDRLMVVRRSGQLGSPAAAEFLQVAKSLLPKT